MSWSVTRTIAGIATALAVMAGQHPARAEGDVVDFVSFGLPLTQWVAERGLTGKSQDEQLWLAQAEQARCVAASDTSEACAKLAEALSVVVRVRHHRASDWQCQSNLEGGDKVVADGEPPSWLIEGPEAFGLFNVSDEAGGATGNTWRRIDVKVYGRPAGAALEALEFRRTATTPWGTLRHHAELGPASSRRLHRAFLRGADVLMSSFDASDKPIRTVKRSLRGYALTMKLCGFG